MAAAKKHDHWIRSFTVSDPTKHEKGFTVYKVTYRAFCLNRPEEVIETVVWKRYNDFKKLDKILSSLHYNLRRPEKFPVFAKAKFFGRFDDDVIEERRQSALKLLDFVVTIPPLSRSVYFRNFFQGGEEVALNPSPHQAILQPQILIKPPPCPPLTADAATPEEMDNGSSPESINPSPSSLGGVWLHRQTEEDVAGYCTADYEGEEEEEQIEEEYDDDDRTTFSDDSVPSTPLPVLQDMSFFDPLSETEPSIEGGGSTLTQSNSWLFKAMDMCAVLSEEASQESPDGSTAPNSTTDLSSDSGITINFGKPSVHTPAAGTWVPPNESSTPVDEACWKGRETPEGWITVPSNSTTPDDLDEARNERNSMARAYLHCIRAQQAAERDALYSDSGIVDSRSPSAKPARSDSTDSNSITNVPIGGVEDYLYQAAHHISLALENEANGSYQAAFDIYKSGVGVLLKGVIADENKIRREAVRRKTAQYLMKAEDLYNKYLSADASNNRRWESEQPSIDIDPRSAHLRGTTDDLKNYKVLGLIDTVLLVLNITTYQTFVVKVLQKCSVATNRPTCVPAYCSYVVKLYRIIESDNAIYMVVEHASGGKLWSYVSSFLHHGGLEADAPSKLGMACSADRSTGGSSGSRRSRHGTTGSRHKEEEEEEEVLFHESEETDQQGRAVVVNDSDISPTDGQTSFGNLMIDYSNESTPQAAVLDSFSGEFAELDLPDAEVNLNDLANRYSQYDNLYTNNVNNRNGRVTPPINLFSIDSIESPGSDLQNSAGAAVADESVFSFKEDTRDPASRFTWLDNHPEETIADTLQIMEDLENKNTRSTILPRTQPLNTHLLPDANTLPDTSGFASVMTSEEMTSSKPGTDLAEFFDTGPSSDGPTSLVKHSLSMNERVAPMDHTFKRTHSNPVDAFFEERQKQEDVLASLMPSSTNIHGRGDFGSVNEWETHSASTRSPPSFSTILGEPEPSVTVSNTDSGQTLLQLETHTDRPAVVLPPLNSRGSLLPTPETIDGTPYSSGDSTPKHSGYSAERENKVTTRVSVDDSQDQQIAYPQDGNPTGRTIENDITPTHQNTTPKSEAPSTAEREVDSSVTRDRSLPPLTTLFANMDERVTVAKLSPTMPESCVRLWAAEILLALTDLHAAGIICRDLRPDNILLAEGGHVRLTYFSQWQNVESELNTSAKDQLYMAPEVSGIYSVTAACDWWSFGALLYELLTGMSLRSCHPSGIDSHTQLVIPDHVSAEATSLLKQLLQVNPRERLGGLSTGGSEEIVLHQFFKDVNWVNLQKQAHI